MCLQSVECVEKVMRQFAMLYRNARNLHKSNIDVGGTTRWRRQIHWDLCGKLGYDREEKYYNHEPQPVYESTNNKLLWYFKIQTDNMIEHNKPDIVVLDLIERKCLIIDVVCPFVIRVKDKEKEKIENYQDLKREVKRIWELRKVTVVPIIIGSLGTRTRKVVGRDWCHIPFRIITESVFTGYSQNPSHKVLDT